MKRKKLSNKTKGKLLIGIPVFLIIGGLLSVFISQFRFDIFWDTIRGAFEQGLENGKIIVILSCFACPTALILMIAIIDHIIPMLCFFVGKPLKYFKIWYLCLKNGYSCRFRRFPFVSLLGVEERADIEIQMNEKTLHIHFLDVPFPVLRMFLLVNDREYRMHNSVPGKILVAGFGMRPGPREMDQNNYTEYFIPGFPAKGTEYHYLVIDPSYATSFFVNEKMMCDVVGECTSGNITVCRWKALKKRLKSNLYAPLK